MENESSISLGGKKNLLALFAQEKNIFEQIHFHTVSHIKKGSKQM